jgi:long-subunit acyl-CoA synthetase (AMP-forming)
MRGYRNDPVRTAEAIDDDGWLHTGDLVRIDDDGHIRIVDRKKELIITSAGKNLSPANIEGELKSASPLIGQAVAIGDGRPYVTALIVLDPDAAAAYAARHGLGDPTPEAVALDDGARRLIADAVVAANERLARVEQVKRFELLAQEWLPGGDELTPTMKLKRRNIDSKYAHAIQTMYNRADGTWR